MTKERFVMEMEFDNQQMAQHFVKWLCGSGEQGYWDWMEYREEEKERSGEEGIDITARTLRYDYETPRIIGTTRTRAEMDAEKGDTDA